MANQLYQPVANSNSLLKRNLDIAKRKTLLSRFDYEIRLIMQVFPNKVNYQNYGLECIGSGWLVHGLINGSCPGNTILTFETARLVMRRTETSARFPHGHPLLPNRCISCGTQSSKTDAKRQTGKRLVPPQIVQIRSGIPRDIV